MNTLIRVYLHRTYHAYHVHIQSTTILKYGALVVYEVTPRNQDDRWLDKQQRVAYFHVDRDVPFCEWDCIAD